MFGWYRDVQRVLVEEPESWLVYLYGQQLENIPHLTRTKPRFRGRFLRLLGHFSFLVRNWSLRQPAAIDRSTDYLIFAGTANQMSALESTADYLKTRGERVLELGNGKLLSNAKQKQRYTPVSFTVSDVVKSLILLVRNTASLHRQLAQKHRVARTHFFDNFCSVYTHLAYFNRVLSRTKPSLVLVSNDHNAPNRALLAVAHQLGIKTAYMQHASVSGLFPALRVNYAFLDGQCAIDTYAQCEPNQPKRRRQAPTPEIVLSGQKKYIKRSDLRGDLIGIALNALDDPDAAITFVETITKAGRKVSVRWHPAQSVKEVARYQEVFQTNDMVHLSDPKNDLISDFLARLGWLVAGNSSIHLEAALAGVLPIYYEITKPDTTDYYGYVKRGLAKPVASIEALLELVDETECNHRADVEAVRYYSATYMTEWEGREGEFVAEYLLSLGQANDKPARSLPKYSTSSAGAT